MKARTGIVLVVVALAALMLATPAFAGQSGSNAQGSAGTQAQSGSCDGDQVRLHTQTQECLEVAERTQLKLRVRSEARIGENTEPSGDGRTRERTRTEDVSNDTSETVEPTETVDPIDTVEPAEAPEPDGLETSLMAANDVAHKQAKIEPAGFMAWIRSVLSVIGL